MKANIAASAYLLYAAGGGPQHWSCKFSPYEDFNYQPQFYKNGAPVGPPPPPPPPTPCSTLPAAGGVIDESSTCFELYGPAQYWRTVTGQGHMGGLRWTNATQQSAPSNWARWQIKLAAAGSYTVQYYAVAAYAKFKSTRYVVRHAGKDKTLIVDQSAGGTGWRTLGTFNFAAGGGQHVSINDDTASPVAQDQHITADAIKLFPAGSPPPPPPPPSSKQDAGTSQPPPPGPGSPDGAVDPGPNRPDSGVPGPAPDGDVPGSNDPYPDPMQPNGVLGGGCSVAESSSGAEAYALLVMLGLLLLRRRRRPA